jgi:hypothetical protein
MMVTSVLRMCLILKMQIYSSCYEWRSLSDGYKKEMFDIIHSSDYSIFSLCQSPHDHDSLFLGERGKVRLPLFTV